MGLGQVSDKIKLAPGQESAEYSFEGRSFADLGAKLDEFYSRIDYTKASPSGSPSAHVAITNFREFNRGEIVRTSLGHYRATVSVDRREAGE
jgi:hypothetical protein